MDDMMDRVMDLEQFSPDWWDEISVHSSLGYKNAQELLNRLESEVAISHHPKLLKAQKTMQELMRTIEPIVQWIENSKAIGRSAISEDEKHQFNIHMRRIADFYLSTGPIRRDVTLVIEDGMFFNVHDQKKLEAKKVAIRVEFGAVLWMIL